MVYFSPLEAEIVSLVWGTRANFNGFHVLAALLHRILVVDVSQSVAFNRGRHLYSAGRLSHWALAHISSFLKVYFVYDDDDMKTPTDNMFSVGCIGSYTRVPQLIPVCCKYI